MLHKLKTRCLRLTGIVLTLLTASATSSPAAVPEGPTTADQVSIKLPRIFGDRMVLQHGMPVPVWGTAQPDQPIEVRFSGQSKSTRADAKGQWRVTLDPLQPSETPAELIVIGQNTLTLRDVLVGDVWLCSGQSNMEYPVKRPEKYRGPPPTSPDPATEALAVPDYPGIRLFKVQKVLSPEDVTTTGWQLCGGEALEKFSAPAFFFATTLRPHINIPIGLIDSSWGGSRIELWTPADAYAKLPAFQHIPNSRPLVIDGATAGKYYDRMIRPLAPFSIRGILWYQGESNLLTTDFKSYVDKSEALINGWRDAWNSPHLPFYFAQLAPYAYANRKQEPPIHPEMLAEFREIQTQTLRIPNTAMIVTTDLVDALGDIHPYNKWEVGRRFALVALHNTYNKTDIIASGPVMASVEFQPRRAVIRFDSVGGGLTSRDGKPLNHFEIAGEDGVFKPATAVIQENNAVEVSSPDVILPVSVRFAWHERAMPNLAGGTGLPAVPFRFPKPPVHP